MLGTEQELGLASVEGVVQAWVGPAPALGPPEWAPPQVSPPEWALQMTSTKQDPVLALGQGPVLALVEEPGLVAVQEPMQAWAGLAPALGPPAWAPPVAHLLEGALQMTSLVREPPPPVQEPVLPVQELALLGDLVQHQGLPVREPRLASVEEAVQAWTGQTPVSGLPAWVLHQAQPPEWALQTTSTAQERVPLAQELALLGDLVQHQGLPVREPRLASVEEAVQAWAGQTPVSGLPAWVLHQALPPEWALQTTSTAQERVPLAQELALLGDLVQHQGLPVREPRLASVEEAVQAWTGQTPVSGLPAWVLHQAPPPEWALQTTSTAQERVPLAQEPVLPVQELALLGDLVQHQGLPVREPGLASVEEVVQAWAGQTPVSGLPAWVLHQAPPPEWALQTTSTAQEPVLPVQELALLGDLVQHQGLPVREPGLASVEEVVQAWAGQTPVSGLPAWVLHQSPPPEWALQTTSAAQGRVPLAQEQVLPVQESVPASVLELVLVPSALARNPATPPPAQARRVSPLEESVLLSAEICRPHGQRVDHI